MVSERLTGRLTLAGIMRTTSGCTPLGHGWLGVRRSPVQIRPARLAAKTLYWNPKRFKGSLTSRLAQRTLDRVIRFGKRSWAMG